MDEAVNLILAMGLEKHLIASRNNTGFVFISLYHLFKDDEAVN